MALASFTLGNPDHSAVEEEFRGGALAFRSRNGIRPVDAVLLEACPKTAAGRVVTGLDSEGILALGARALYPESPVFWWTLDAYVGTRAEATLARNGVTDVTVAVTADLPGLTTPRAEIEKTSRAALVVLPFPARGDALFARDTLEQAHDLLVGGGRLVAATDGDPTWLRQCVRDVFGKADITTFDAGTAVFATRTKAAAVWKDRRHVLQVTLGARTLGFGTRPGVFSYGRLDRGTRALLDAAVPRCTGRTLDLGCGTGVLGLFAAVQAPGASAVLVDSNARAIALARDNAVAAGTSAADVRLESEPLRLEAASFDHVLANPPYFADFRIAEAFVRGAKAALRPGGDLALVAKAAEHHAAIVHSVFGMADIEMRGEYGVITARA